MKPVVYLHSDAEAVVSGQGGTWRISIQNNGWFRRPTLKVVEVKRGG